MQDKSHGKKPAPITTGVAFSSYEDSCGHAKFLRIYFLQSITTNLSKRFRNIRINFCLFFLFQSNPWVEEIDDVWPKIRSDNRFVWLRQLNYFILGLSCIAIAVFPENVSLYPHNFAVRIRYFCPLYFQFVVNCV